MHIFVTGASGFIGQATVAELLKHGYEVTGLVRTQEKADALAKTGAKALLGDLNDLDSLRKGAANSDGVIHLAFIHDFSNPGGFSDWCASDRAAIEAMAKAMSGTGKPLIIASGTLMTPTGVLADEDTPPEYDHPPFSDRALSADLVEKLSKEENIRGIIIRFSPTVHGKEDKGFMTMFIDVAKKNGAAFYVDDGSAVWPAVHRLDSVVLLRLALEKGKAGATYNAVAEQGVSMKNVMGLIGKTLGLPVESKARDDPDLAKLGFVGAVVGLDNPTSSIKTQKALGWTPKELGLLADLEANYF